MGMDICKLKINLYPKYKKKQLTLNKMGLNSMGVHFYVDFSNKYSWVL